MKTTRPNQQHAARAKEPEQKKLYVRDVMTDTVAFVEPDQSVRDVAKRLHELDVGALPVCDNGMVVGMITDRDIVVRVVAEDKNLAAAVGDVMTADIVCAHEDDEVNAVVKRMQKYEVRRIPVINRDHRLVGIVALADLANSHVPARLKAKGLQGVS